MSTQSPLIKIIIHGGYINESNLETKPGRQSSVQCILQAAYTFATTTTTTTTSSTSPPSPSTPSAAEIAVFTVSQLEDDPLFNAGTGSRIQGDGKIRMSASLIDSARRKFSGVVNIENVQNPSQIALCLQSEEDSVLCGEHAKTWATEHNFGDYDPEIPVRREEWERLMAAQQLAQQLAQSSVPKTGTVGCVVLKDGIIAACTSTGGKGCEIPGRVSDSCTPAGCFATANCGVSVTGVGEHAMASAMASAICIRRDDGMTFDRALGRTIDDLNSFQGISGAVCLDIDGNFAHDSTTSGMVWALHDGDKIEYFQ